MNTPMEQVPMHWRNSVAVTAMFSRGMTSTGDRKRFFPEVQIPVVPDIGQQILQLRAGDIDAVPTGYPIAQLGGIPSDLAVSAAPSVSSTPCSRNPARPR